MSEDGGFFLDLITSVLLAKKPVVSFFFYREMRFRKSEMLRDCNATTGVHFYLKVVERRFWSAVSAFENNVVKGRMATLSSMVGRMREIWKACVAAAVAAAPSSRYLIHTTRGKITTVYEQAASYTLVRSRWRPCVGVNVKFSVNSCTFKSASRTKQQHMGGLQQAARASAIPAKLAC